MFRYFDDDDLKLLQCALLSHLTELDIQVSFRVPGAIEAVSKAQRFLAIIQVELDERASQKIQGS